jgi:hypothetical protein
METETGKVNELYIPRKWYASKHERVNLHTCVMQFVVVAYHLVP